MRSLRAADFRIISRLNIVNSTRTIYARRVGDYRYEVSRNFCDFDRPTLTVNGAATLRPRCIDVVIQIFLWMPVNYATPAPVTYQPRATWIGVIAWP